MRTSKKTTPVKQVCHLAMTEPYRLASKYFPRVFVPCQAVDERWRKLRVDTDEQRKEWLRAKFITTDGKLVRLKFISTLNNGGQYFAEEFEHLCQRMFNMPFVQVQSHWIARLGYLDNYWDMIDLELVDDNA